MAWHVGLTLLFTGLLLRAWAMLHLRRAGLTLDQFYRPRRPARRATAGPYRFSHHPCYLGSLMVLAGVGLMALGPWGWVLFLPAWPLYADRMYRENRLLGRF